MEFEWDAIKSEHNLAKHGMPFEYATRAFFDPRRVDRKDDRRDYSEERRITLGKIGGRVVAVAYTLRGEKIRLISARKANPRERRQYDKALST
jgi:uncharacterized DUF497 family protein